MFCPECRSEYRAGFTRCIDCGGELVDRLPERGELQAGEDRAGPAIVFVTSHASEAALVRSLLEASGVDVYGFNENVSRIFHFTEMAGIQLAVAASQAELAQEIVAEYRAKLGQNPTDAGDPE